eukprot:scaffold338676_cov59-Attheya_sp.AAC.1
MVRRCGAPMESTHQRGPHSQTNRRGRTSVASAFVARTNTWQHIGEIENSGPIGPHPGAP